MADADLNINVKTSPKDPFGSIFNSLKDINSEVSGTLAGFKSIGVAIAGVAALGGAFDFIVDATRETEELETQFRRFGLSVSEAEEQLIKLSEIPGPDLRELANANRVLLSFGVGTEESIRQLQILNDVAAGTGSKIEDLSEIFGKVQQEGSLTAETFKKLSKEIPGFAQDLARGLGAPVGSLKTLAEQGDITADRFVEAFEKMTSDGGRFFKAAENSANTLNGALDRLGDSFFDLAAAQGKQLSPALTGLINIFAKLVEGNTAFIREQEKIASETGPAKRIREITGELSELGEEIEFLGSLRGKLGYLGEDRFRTDKIKELKQEYKELGLERLKLIKQKGIAETIEKDAQDAERQAEIQRKAADKRLAEQKAEADKRAEIEKKEIEERAKRIEESFKNIAALEQQQIAARSALQAAQAEKEKTEAQRAAEDAAQASLEAERGRVDALTAYKESIARGELEKQRADEDALTQAKIDAAIQRETQITTALAEANATRAELLGQNDEAEIIRTTERETRLTEAMKKGEEDRLKILRQAQKDEFNLDKINADAKKKFDEQTYAGRVATAQAGLNALISLQRTGNRDAFNIGKAAAIAQALVAIPTTAIEAYKSLAGIPVVGPALGAAAAAAAVVAGTAQVNQIRQQQPIGFAKGGKVEGSGNKDTVPAMLTPGEVVVPKQNFAQLEENFVRGAIADDQVQLLMQGNAITAKILDQLTIGVVNEKLTRMVALLDDIRNQIEISNRSTLSGSEDILAPEVIPIRPVRADNNSQRPRQRDRVGVGRGRNSEL